MNKHIHLTFIPFTLTIILVLNFVMPQAPMVWAECTDTAFARSESENIPTDTTNTLVSLDLPVASPDLPLTNLPASATVEETLAEVNDSLLFSTVQTLVSFQNRHALSNAAPETQQGGLAAGEWILSQFNAIKGSNPNVPIDVFAQTFDFSIWGGQYASANLAMKIEGADCNAGVVIIGAHYDTVMGSSPDYNGGYQPGANDNGSGIAAILELARVMGQAQHRATVFFVLFGAEEMGRFGSIAFAQDYVKAQNLNVIAMINLDMIGNPVGPYPNRERHDTEMRIYSEGPNNSTSRHIARLSAFATAVYFPEMTVYVKDAGERQGRWGDQQSFSDLGYPAVRLIQFDDDPELVHNSNDDLNHVDAAYLQRTTTVALLTLLALSDGLSAPTLDLSQSDWRLSWTPVPNAVSYVVALRSQGSLQYDYALTVQNLTELTSANLAGYEAVSVAAVDANGQIGVFTEEITLTENVVAMQ